MAAQDANVLLPMKLDAFVFNEQVCEENADGTAPARICSFNQPNYTFLRVDDFLAQNDLVNHADVHASIPACINSRAYDLGKGAPRKNRYGVYLHWILPRAYRSGHADTDTGRAPEPGMDFSAPSFPKAPNRWLVIRRILEPTDSPLPPIQAWVVESDTRRDIDDLPLTVDLQVDVSPFLSPNGSLREQQEIFIGLKQDASVWQEQNPSDAVDLGLLNSSNTLFPDYQLHNGNVFSVLDTFYDPAAPENPDKALPCAVASYYVMGWHSNPADGLFYHEDITHQARLQLLAMTLNPQDVESPMVSEWLRSHAKTSTICHGAMYDVKWDISCKPPTRPGDKFSDFFLESQPVAVGTTAVDALLTYIHDHHDSSVEKDIFTLEPLLRAQDESTQAQRAAADEVQNSNYSRFAGGTRWKLADNPNASAPLPPDGDLAKALKILNQHQTLADVASRYQTSTSWQLFSLWWKYITDGERSGTSHVLYAIEYAEEARKLYQRWLYLQDQIKTQLDMVNEQRGSKAFPVPPTTAVLPEYQRQADPTLLIAGVDSAWPFDFLDALRVRLDFQTVPGPEGDDKAAGVDRLPQTLQDAAKKLFSEFLLYQSDSQSELHPPSDTPASLGDPEPTYAPLYHDQGDPASKPMPQPPWRDRWNDTQPWFPLYVEWEAEYFHIPFDGYWSIDKKLAFKMIDKPYRYGIKDGITLYTDKNTQINDIRIASGRVLILPQPAFSLKALIVQLFASTPKDVLDKILPPERQTELLNGLSKLPFLSAPMSGLRDHLTTLLSGTHIKPNSRVPPQALKPIPDAVVESKKVGLDEPQVSAMGKETDLLPYGSLVQIDDAKYYAFKPVTHGQFRFTKLNVIDKFGQVACAIDPTPRENGPPPLYPHISSYYTPEALTSDPMKANVVRPPEPDMENCSEFVQLPPTINQSARLNSVFVVPNDNTNKGYWRPTSEWDDPVWGWAVVNYVDYGIQLFLKDGTFYTEVRLAAPNAPEGAVAGAKWLPYERKTPSGTEQLDKLIEAFTAPKTGTAYLVAFIKMCSSAAGDSAATPSSYATYMNSLVGKPLAMVNAGWSIELASDAYNNQSSIAKQVEMLPPKTLLPDPKDSEKQYKFPIKFGDQSREHDGLVGYWNAYDPPAKGREIDLNKLFTYFAESESENFELIGQANFNELKAFWLNPTDEKYKTNGAEAYEEDWNQQLKVIGIVMDPFQPIHAFSSILPSQPLLLPPWTWETALKKMTAFFHVGPIVLPQDRPPYEKPTLADSLDEPRAAALTKIPLPSLAIASWEWLQPYSVDENGREQGQEGAQPPFSTEFLPFELARTDTRAKLEKSPYTAVEGYLEMKRPIVDTAPTGIEE